MNPAVMLVVIVGLFFGTIFVAQATGNYQVLPEALKNGETISISEVKGYYTIEEAAAATGLALQEIYERLGIPVSVPKNTQLKNVSGLVEGFELDTAKESADTDAVGAAAETQTGEAVTVITTAGETAQSEMENKIDVSSVRGSMTY
jgi:hypothetical protein